MRGKEGGATYIGWSRVGCYMSPPRELEKWAEGVYSVCVFVCAHGVRGGVGACVGRYAGRGLRDGQTGDNRSMDRGSTKTEFRLNRD